MHYEEIKGDLMTQTKANVIAHCISVDCAMGAGVVIPIRNKFPNLKDACINYVDACVKMGTEPLNTAYRYNSKIGTCYNMFTKDKVYYNAQNMGEGVYLNNLRKTLTDLKNQMIYHGENELAIPKIASGLDRCNWDDVKELIKDVFKDTDISVYVFYIN